MFSRWTLDIVTPPFGQDVALDRSPIARKSEFSLLWRKLRPALALRWHRQSALLRPAIDKPVRRILWIYKGSPQVGDSLMDLSSRVLLRDAGIEVDLYTDPHLHRLYEADDVFARVCSDPAALAGRSHDLVILDSFKWRCIEAKIAHWRKVPFVTMRGHFVGPEFNRTLFSFFRMQQLLGIDIAEGAVRRMAMPHMAATASDRQLAEQLHIPHDALAFAIGGASEGRTYRHWGRVLQELLRRGKVSTVVLLGSSNAIAMRNAIVDAMSGTGMQIIDCVDRYSLTQAFEIVKCCALAVSADGGLLHVAHAAGRPTVSLFDRHIGPALRLTEANRSIALQSAGVISDIPATAVADGIEQALGQYVENEAGSGKRTGSEVGSKTV